MDREVDAETKKFWSLWDRIEGIHRDYRRKCGGWHERHLRMLSALIVLAIVGVIAGNWFACAAFPDKYWMLIAPLEGILLIILLALAGVAVMTDDGPDFVPDEVLEQIANDRAIPQTIKTSIGQSLAASSDGRVQFLHLREVVVKYVQGRPLRIEEAGPATGH